MPIKCYNKPNRKKPRVFTEKDVRRIAKYAIDDGASAFEIAAGVFVAAGLGYLICVASRAIDNSANIYKAVLRIGGILALGRVIDFLLTLLSSGVFRRLPRTNQIALVLVLAVAALESILKAAKSLLEDAEIIVSAADAIHVLCNRARELAIESGEFIGNKYDDAADFTEDLFDR